MKDIVRLVLLAALCALGISAQVTALRVGHLVDPEAGTVAANQVVLIENGKFSAVGPNVSIPTGAETVDLSQYYISPGLVDAHNHLALTYKEEPEHNSYYLTSVLDSTAIRAIQAAIAIRDVTERDGLRLRAGIHTGEVEVHGEKFAGIAMHIGARIAAAAGTGEILVSRTVRDLVAGSGLELQDRGLFQLKGVAETWQLYAARAY